MIHFWMNRKKNSLDLIYYKGSIQVQAAEELKISVGILRSRLQTSIRVLRRIFMSDQEFNPATRID
jgi:hypothetical protein